MCPVDQHAHDAPASHPGALLPASRHRDRRALHPMWPADLPDCMIPAPVGHQCPECVAEARREYRRGPGRQVAVANVKTMSVTKLLLAAIVDRLRVGADRRGRTWLLVPGPSGQALIDAGALVPYSGGDDLAADRRHRRRRVLAPADLDLPARRHHPPRPERLHPVDLRHDDGAGHRPGLHPGGVPRHGGVRGRDLLRVRAGVRRSVWARRAPSSVSSGRSWPTATSAAATCWRRPGSAPRSRSSSSTSCSASWPRA